MPAWQAGAVHLGRILSFASLALGVLFYVASVAGLLWPATSPLDVGLVATSAIFVLFGAFGLLLKPEAAKQA